MDFRGTGNNPHDLPHGDLEQGGFTIYRTYPEARAPKAPDHVPENIAAFYVQAVDNLKRSQWDAAGGMFRKVLETTTKRLAPEHKKKRLVERIDILAEAGQITDDLKTWAHEIRIIGNDAAHEEEPFEEKHASDLAKFSKLFLMYVFTLPGMLKERRGATAEEGGDG
jgi:hypothetical protein